MVLRKPKADFSIVNGGVFQNRKCVVNGVGSRRKTSQSVDQWAFLEEIEAPMWVDLMLETKSMNQDIHDAWFQVTHPFHQCSSDELMSANSLSTEGYRNSNSELLGSYSPTLPPSVSRSRGKDYRGRKWGESNHVVSLNKQHPIGSLGERISQMVRESVQEIKPKYKFGNQKDIATKKKSSICLSSSTASTRSNSSNTMSTFRDTKSSSRVTSSVIGESNSSSTAGNLKSSSNFKVSPLAENNQQQLQESFEISHQTSGLTNRFFLPEGNRFTRTGVMRQPSRVEIKHSDGNKSSSSKPSVLLNLNPGKQSNGRKSSSSKSSSVGSSMNPRCDFKDTTLAAVMNSDTTPESRKVISFGQAAKHPKQKASNVSKTSSIQDRDITSISQLGGKALDGKSTNQRSRVLCQSEPTNALQPSKIRVPSHVSMKAEETVGTRRSNRVAGSKNLNATGSMILGKISSGKENAAGVIPGRKPTQQSKKVMNVKGLSVIKRKTKRGNQSNNPVDAVQRIYFR